MISAQQAIKELQKGNQRFAADDQSPSAITTKERRQELVAGQTPFATILSCSDSRAPVELIFDQGLGDLFVIRVAGNIIVPSVIGSIEFAVQQLGTPLIVILGHSQCGAVSATIDDLVDSSVTLSPNLQLIIDHIRPSVAGLLKTPLKHDKDALTKQAVRANINASANQLRRRSKIVDQLVANSELHIICAEYSLESGIVDFFVDATEV